MIKAPFNFVPLADDLYIPNWADQISQDVPFSDGISGCIELKISAKTPIFVRNGHNRDEKKNNDSTYRSFSNTPDGKYFIPATSIKGELRSILEIMSFSRLRTDVYARYAQREWDDNFLYPIKRNQSQLRCGYLKWDTERQCFTIKECQKSTARNNPPYRISFQQIDDYLKRKYNCAEAIFQKHFSKESNTLLNDNVKISEEVSYDPKTAAYKYYLIGKACLGKVHCVETKDNQQEYFDKAHEVLSDLHFEVDMDTSTEFSKRLKVSDSGKIKGDIVLTGQPDLAKWNRPTELDKTAGKFYEFVFVEESGAELFQLTDLDYNNHKFIYADTKEWKRVQHLMYSMEQKGAPVFFRIINGNIDFGLAYLYKLPYQYSPYSILKNKYDHYLAEKRKDVNALDLAQCIFGTIDDRPKEEKKTSNKEIPPLRGRVQFTNAFTYNGIPFNSEQPLALSSPKASYYPFYISQEGSGGRVNGRYRTYNDGEIAGWKRYVLKRTAAPDNTGDPQIDTNILPLQPGAIFKERIHFHNLRPIELGALLSALSFHNTNNTYHQLGQGKPYGFGRVTYEIQQLCGKDINDEPLFNQTYYMGLFEQEMDTKLNMSWKDTKSVTALITLAQTLVEGKDSQFQYMKLDVNNRDSNEFLIAKGYKTHPKEYLQSFNDLTRANVSIKSLLEYINPQKVEEMRIKNLIKDIKSRDIPKNSSNTEELSRTINELQSLKEKIKDVELLKDINDLIQKCMEKLSVLKNPTQLSVGETMTALCIANKKVRIDGYDYDIQLTMPKGSDADSIVSKNVEVRIKQISKIGKIVQVEFVKVL